jgi:APA family basic amino acid/polyamine antiporter
MAAGFLPIDFLAETTSIGTLFAFTMVHISTIIMHWSHRPQEITDTASRLSDDSEIQAMQNIRSRFRFPSRTLICPILGIITCLLLMSFVTKWTAVRFIVWNVAIGQPVYWLYSRKHSVLGNRHRTNFESIDPTNPCRNNLAQGQQQHTDISAITTTTHTIIDNRATSSVNPTKIVNVHENIVMIRL